jgi:hypothetical protein
MSVYTSTYLGAYGSGTFPQVPLGVEIDLDVGGWTGITSYAVQQDWAAATITRARQNETTNIQASTCPMRWNNTGARFDPDNPAGPYYGLLGLNTPVRISVSSGTYLRFADDSQSYISCPDSAALQLGELDARIDLRLDDWRPCTLAGKWGGSATLWSWCLLLNGDATVSLVWYDGTTVSTAQSTAPLFPGRAAIRATLAISGAALVTFYTAPGMGGTFTQLGDVVTVAGAGAAQNAATQAIQVGYVDGFLGQGVAAGNSGLLGKVFEFALYNASATLVADPVFTTATADASTMADSQGNTWTVEGTAELSGRSYRYHGECSSLPEEWDPTGHDIWTACGASGVLRRIQQGNSPILSAMRRGVTGNILPAFGGVQGYWPFEDNAGSTQVASGLPGGTPMGFSGAPSFQGQAGSLSADSIFACSASLAQIGSATFGWTLPARVTSTIWGHFLLFAIPSGGFADGTVLATISYSGRAWIQLGYAAAAGGTLTMATSTEYSFDGPAGVNGQAYWLEIESGGADVSLNVLPLGAATGSTYGGGVAWTSETALGGVINPGGANLGSAEIGHLLASANPPAIDGYAALLNAYAGETAAARFARLCGENSLQARIYGPPDASCVMGPQQIDTLMNVLQSVEDADRGQIYEPRETLGLGYRILAAMVNQSPALTFDYSAGEVSPPMKPTRDDLLVRNDVTLTRNNGSSVQVQQLTGPLSILPPPDGAGDYDTSLTVYVNSDSQLNDIAGWWVHTGTVAGKRYPLIVADLASTDADMQALIPYVRDTDIGDYLQVINTPQPLLPPGDIGQLAWGITETVGDFVWRFQFNAVPESPYEVAAAGTARADTDGATLTAGVSSTATSLSVATTNSGSPLWDTGDAPFYITIAGEEIEVTAVSGGTSPQTFTVVRSVNGVVKAQASGAAVVLAGTPTVALAGAAA